MAHKLHEFSGVLHIHSVFSDGTGTVEEIAGYANECGLDFLIITDHNTLRTKTEGLEGYYGNLLVIAGVEINDKANRNHYLAMGIQEAFSTRSSAEDYVKKVKNAGGIGFLAHPHESRSEFPEHPPYPWTDWHIQEFTGMEIWNHMSEWMENLTEQNKYNSFVHPLRTIIAPKQITLQTWDRLSLERRVVGIGGVDAHAHKVSVLGMFDVEVFPYKVLFKSIRTHILAGLSLNFSETGGDSRKGEAILVDALRNGRCFVSNYYHGNAAGFRFYALSAGREYHQGDTLPLINGAVPGDTEVFVTVPERALIRLIRNGEIYYTTQDTEARLKIAEPGVYRVEVLKDGNAWIFSNHIRLVPM